MPAWRILRLSRIAAVLGVSIGELFESPKDKPGDAKNAAGIRVYSPDGKLLKTMPLAIKPRAICTAKDGSIFVAGDGRVLIDAIERLVNFLDPCRLLGARGCDAGNNLRHPLDRFNNFLE